MPSEAKIQTAQKYLQEEGVDGWLLYDFQGLNPFARQFLDLEGAGLVSRRYFYWIPARGAPRKLLHVIEPHTLDGLPGESAFYLKWSELESGLADLLRGARKVAMEYSPRAALPYISKVDGGMIDLVRGFGVEVVSSASFLQYFTCVLSDAQLELHIAAGQFLDHTAAKTWEKISHALKTGSKLTEYDVRMFIAGEFEKHHFEAEHLPICAVNAHSADPHFEPKKEESRPIQRGDFILIDLWCKKSQPGAVYGDITRVGVADTQPTARQKEIFQIVRRAQKACTDHIQTRYSRGELTRGCDADQVCRKVIEQAGYGQYFTHRTGHNIYTKDHGPGAHLDNLETIDSRSLIPSTCFSVEPGIYLPGEFGIRLEYDLFLAKQGETLITGGVQEEIVTLF